MIRRAMILAAGRGRRLAPRTDQIPKPLIPIAERPFIEHLLAFLRAGGIEEVVVNLHHLGNLIEQALGDGRRFGLAIRYSWEPHILDTGGGIKRVEPLLTGEPFVVVNGDSLLELPLADVLAFHRQRAGIATLVLRSNPAPDRYAPVEIDADDRVRRIAGLPPGDPAPALRRHMFAGLHVLEPSVFDWMEPDRVFGITAVTYPRLIAAGVAVYGFVTDARWVTIDTPEDVTTTDAVLRQSPFRF